MSTHRELFPKLSDSEYDHFVGWQRSYISFVAGAILASKDTPNFSATKLYLIDSRESDEIEHGFTCVVQRDNGETPASKFLEAGERAEKAEARVAKLEDAIVCFGNGDGDNGISEAYGEIMDREMKE